MAKLNAETRVGPPGETGESVSPPPEVRQLYSECLTALFRDHYYKKLHGDTLTYAKVFDFCIALGAAVSGGSGLGILADPRLAWVCGIVTTASLLLSVAKGVWGWDAKTKFALERVQFYGDLGSKYLALVDDVNAARSWNGKFQTRREQLRTASNPATPDPYRELSEKKQVAIQESIKGKIPYTSWWGWT